MATTPFFTIVIPTYNRAGLILNTLETVFSQSFQDYEVIVVDNCSTDNTYELLMPLIAAGKITFIQHDKNYERAKSRNTGIQHARGNYLTYLDSDDFMYEDNLKDAFHFIEQEPRYKVFHNLYELVNANKQKVSSYSFKPLRNPRKQITTGNFLSCIGVFVSREVYTAVAWDETPILTGSEDYDYWLRVIAFFPQVGRIEKVNSGILEHPARTVNTSDLEQTKKRFEYFFNKIDKDPVYVNGFGTLRYRIKATLWTYLAEIAAIVKDWKSMKYFLYRAFQTDKGVVRRRNFLSLCFRFLKRTNN
ncbi:MAG: hypothetical protein JWO58_2697 [Chitinophagaceae bacterium]|nr:hypothetical protein [Chitinophagaceae bacterium]